jgi:SnoaL-like domain
MDGLGELKSELQQLRDRVGLLEDQQAVRTLQFKYGYYMDKCLFGDIVELFAEDATLYFLNGIFRGKEGARRLYGGATGLNGPIQGLRRTWSMSRRTGLAHGDGFAVSCRAAFMKARRMRRSTFRGSSGRPVSTKTNTRSAMASGASRCSTIASCTRQRTNRDGRTVRALRWLFLTSPTSIPAIPAAPTSCGRLRPPGRKPS